MPHWWRGPAAHLNQIVAADFPARAGNRPPAAVALLDLESDEGR
jgi:hypothetical protein